MAHGYGSERRINRVPPAYLAVAARETGGTVIGDQVFIDGERVSSVTSLNRVLAQRALAGGGVETSRFFEPMNAGAADGPSAEAYAQARERFPAPTADEAIGYLTGAEGSSLPVDATDRSNSSEPLELCETWPPSAQPRLPDEWHHSPQHPFPPVAE